MKPAFIFHPDFDSHDTGPSHPENWTRTRRIHEAVREGSLGEQFTFHEPDLATSAQIEAVHSKAYHRFIEEACLSGAMMVDSGETLVGQDSYRAALLSAGSALKAVDLVLKDEAATAFSCSRPPGHHATRDHAMGFCLFNNVAVAARHAQKVHGIERVLIIDWDVHHGNGTQELFYDDPSVFYFSVHQRPLYPGSGASGERGRDAGEGYTLNCPVPPGSRIAAYRTAWQEQLGPAADSFKPQLILISAGFDAHREDPLADIELESEDFGELTRMTLDIAARHAGCRVASILEGGYNVDVLGDCVGSHLQALAACKVSAGTNDG